MARPRPPLPGAGPLVIHVDTRHRCPTCQSVGFEVSVLGGDRCTFCDGTEGGNPPTPEEMVSAQAPTPISPASDPQPADDVPGTVPAVVEASIEDDLNPFRPNYGEWRARQDVLDLVASQPEPAPAPAPDLGDTLESEETEPLYESPADEPQYLYIAGDAGTGKSWTARRRAEDYKDAILLATTGIAAINLDGTTINSCLRYFDTASMQLEYEYGRLGQALRQLHASGVRRMVIDECSMMDGRQLDILCLAMDDVNDRLLDNSQDPMGITLTGDFAQLPPVGVDKKKGYDGTIYTFEAKCWQRFADNTLTLREVKRQADPDFIKAIQQVRRGDKACVDYFRRFITPNEISEFDGSTILAKNDEVDRYNKIRMLRLNTPVERFVNQRTGNVKDMPSEWKNIPAELELKPGCLVMVLANAYDQGDGDGGARQLIYCNGDLAHYEGQQGQLFAQVRLVRTGRTAYIGRVVRERLKPGVQRRLRPGKVRNPDHVLSMIDYMPLRVAYATTCHKSQGLSLDNVQLLINSQFWLSGGMTYVGLSRVRTPQGLRIVGSPEQFAARVRVNQRVVGWL